MQSQSQTQTQTQTQTPKLPIGALKRTLTASQVASLAHKRHITQAKIEHVRYVSSFNLLNNASDATIIVPGQPPRWTPSRDDEKLQEDRGEYYRDKNAAKFPQHPMAPAVTACLTSPPALLADVDIFACNSTLGNLLRFVRRKDKECRILVEKCGQAVFLVRRENSPTELLQDVYGYGHTFPEAFTTWDSEVKTSDSHQRIISYQFGGLKLLVRFTADGYFAHNETNGPVKQDGGVREAAPSVSQDATDSSLDTLAKAVLSTRLTTAPTGSASEADIAVRKAGRAPDQSQIFDIKTRTIRKKEWDNLAAQLPRLWVAQIPQFVLAFHENGLFRTNDIKVQDVRDEVQAWESTRQRDLAKLAVLLHLIHEECNKATEGDGKMEILIGNRELKMCEQVDGVPPVLPADLKARWEAMNAKPTEDALKTNVETQNPEAA